jgi:hypothetical protein
VLPTISLLTLSHYNSKKFLEKGNEMTYREEELYLGLDVYELLLVDR